MGMNVSFVLFFVAGLFALAAFVGLCVLQVFLSRKPSPGPGLVLPILTFALTVFLLAPILLSAVTKSIIESDPRTVPSAWEAPDGVPREKWEDVMEMEARAAELPQTSDGTSLRVAVILIPFLFIPTLVYTVIYIVCRVTRKKPPSGDSSGYATPTEWKKMNIQDL